MLDSDSSQFEVLFEIANRRTCMMFRDRQFFPQLKELTRKRLIWGFNSAQSYAVVSLTCKGSRLMYFVDKGVPN